ncbi:MAG: 3-oxoacyl-ACP reductase FabG [Desulfobulbaceae bacterium]|nr:3-oxoacyl-ACP reductase FabG [Desulfobulbaceae bacterium]
MVPLDNTNKTVFITGASRGIGAAIARRLAASGFDIWLNYAGNHEAAKQVATEVEQFGRKCTLLPFDVSDEDAIEETLVPLLEDEVPYGFVHNAGIARDSLAAMMPRKDWDRVLGVHLTGFFLLSRLLVKSMLGKRQGRIIAIGSVSGEMGQPGQINYAAAKAGLVGACKTLAKEVGRRNILVNVVSPGLIETDMIRDVPTERVLPLIPLGRVGQPEEVAGMVNFLLGEEAGYITGQVISINGGLYI